MRFLNDTLLNNDSMEYRFCLPADVSIAMDGRVQFALDLAIAAGNTTLQYFRTNQYQVERKRDKSPVTQADKSAEETVRKLISDRFPADAILGEEFGTVAGNSPYEWIIDPIDGTKSFISGVPLYSTLVGMTIHGEPTIGVIAIPAMGEVIVAAKGFGAWYGAIPLNSFQATKPTEDNAFNIEMTRANVSRQSKLEDGLLLTSQSDNFAHRNATTAYQALESLAYITRTWGDGYGYLLVATGRAEVMVDPIVNPWDVAAVAPVILEAGGRFSTWDGQYDIRKSHCIGSNGLVHDEVISHLKAFA